MFSKCHKVLHTSLETVVSYLSLLICNFYVLAYLLYLLNGSKSLSVCPFYLVCCSTFIPISSSPFPSFLPYFLRAVLSRSSPSPPHILLVFFFFPSLTSDTTFVEPVFQNIYLFAKTLNLPLDDTIGIRNQDTLGQGERETRSGIVH